MQTGEREKKLLFRRAVADETWVQTRCLTKVWCRAALRLFGSLVSFLRLSVVLCVRYPGLCV